MLGTEVAPLLKLLHHRRDIVLTVGDGRLASPLDHGGSVGDDELV